MKATTLRTLRRLHLYVAVFFAPAIMFFGFSGILQTYGLHETHSTPAWIKAMANLHKHQRLHRPERPKPAAAPAAPRAPAGDKDAAPTAGNTVGMAALKLFTGLMGLGLVVASLLGIAVALGTRSTRRVATMVLAIGLVLPAVLIFA